MGLNKWLGFVLAASAAHPALAAERASQAPLLVIGASYAEGKTPFNDGIAPLGGVAVGSGKYLSLGQALTRNLLLPGYVINEAQAGATTFAHAACAPGASTCGPAGWDSYQTQLDQALARVAIPPAFTQLTARYVVIATPNDCLHSDASGIPQALAQPCTPAQLNQVVDRLIAVGSSALARGVTPVFDIPPRYSKLDLNLFRTLYGLNWVIGQADYNTLRDLSRTRIKAELPQAIVLDIWKDFVHQGDGIHPTPATTRQAAMTIAVELVKRDFLPASP